MKYLYRAVLARFQNTLFKNSIIVFSGSMIANAGAYLYHLALGRILGPIGYGEIASLVSILYILGVPTIVIQTVLIKYFSTHKANDSVGKSRQLFIKATRSILVLLLASSAILGLLSPLIASFLHLDSWTYMLWLLIIFIFSTLSIINASVLQGYQLFVMVAIFTALPILLKLVISVPLAFWGVGWALIAGGIAGAISYGLYMIPVRFLFSKAAVNIDLTKKQVLGFSIPTLLTVLGTTSLYSTDIIMAKHYLTPAEAGIYSAVAILGKIIFFASSAVTLVTYPIVSERNAKGERSRSLIFTALTLVGFITVSFTLMYVLIPDFIVTALFGTSYLGAVPYMGMFGVFMTFFTLSQLLSMISLAQNKIKIGFISSGMAFCQLILIIVLHGSIKTIIYVNIFISILFFAATLVNYRLTASTYEKA